MKTARRPRTWTRASARARDARAVAAGGYTRAEVKAGDYPPLRLLVPAKLWREFVAARERLDRVPVSPAGF